MAWLRFLVLLVLAIDWWEEPLHGSSLLSEPLSSQPALFSSARLRGDSLFSSVPPPPGDTLSGHAPDPVADLGLLSEPGGDDALPHPPSRYVLMALRW